MAIGGSSGYIGDSAAKVSIKETLLEGKEFAAEQREAAQATAKESMQAQDSTQVFRSKVPKKEKTVKARSKTVTKLKGSGTEKKSLPVEILKRHAQKYEQRNPELKAKVLQLLREKIKPGATLEEIAEILAEFYPDPSLADEAMEFLLDTTEGTLHQEVQAAKDKLNEEKGREIVAGRNINAQARAASEKGLGTPTNNRDLYRDITGNPRDSNTLFEELSQKYAFGELKKVIDFLLHSLGADMKSKGPSIDRGELHRLITETRSLQAILGVYRFYKNRMGLMRGMFSKGGLPFPDNLNFEQMSKAFMSLTSERYPSSDKVLGQAKRLGVEDWTLGKIIVFSQFRDSVKELSMSQIYRSLQHRDDLFNAIIEALENLEDQLEDQLEAEEVAGNEIDIDDNNESTIDRK